MIQGIKLKLSENLKDQSLQATCTSDFSCSLLTVLGVGAAVIDGSPVFKSTLRVCLWAVLAMVVTIIMGRLFDVFW